MVHTGTICDKGPINLSNYIYIILNSIYSHYNTLDFQDIDKYHPTIHHMFYHFLH